MLAAIGVGVWAMIFMTALTQGMVNDMIKDGISVLPGHVLAHHPDYRDDPNINNLIPTPDSELMERLNAAGFAQWATRIKVPAVITSERDARGVHQLEELPRRVLFGAVLAPAGGVDLDRRVGRPRRLDRRLVIAA